MYVGVQTQIGSERKVVGCGSEELAVSQASAENRLSIANVSTETTVAMIQPNDSQLSRIFMKLHTKLTLGLISTVFAANLVLAADSGAKMSMNNPGIDCKGMSMMPGDMGTNPVAHAQKHLAELKAKLKLTKDQQPAWETFSTQVNDQAKNMAAMQDKKKDMTQAMSKSAPEHMAMMAEMMKTRAENMAKMADAVKTFYTELSTDQQKAFDKMHAEHMSHMGHMK